MTFPATIAYDLIHQGLLFNTSGQNGKARPTFTYTQTTLFNNGSTYLNTEAPASHLVVLTSNTTGVGSVFEVKIAVDTENVVNSDMTPTGDVNMDTFSCILQSEGKNQTVFNIARSINATELLHNLLNPIAGSLYPSLRYITAVPSEQIIAQLQFQLNSMFMVSGSNQVFQQNIEGYTNGVVIGATILPYWVLTMCIIYGLSMVMILILTGYLFVQNQKMARSYDSKHASSISSTDINEHAPVGLYDWTKYGTYLASRGKSDLQNFKPGRYMLDAHSHGREIIDIVLTHGHIDSETSTMYNGADGNQKVDRSTSRENGALLSKRV